MATTTPRSQPRPAKDEWGVYDPQQAGLAALFARLDTKDPKAAPATPAQKLEAIVAQKVEAQVEAAAPAPARPTLRDAK